MMLHRRSWLSKVVGATVLVCTGLIARAAEIEVQGLFTDAAMLNIDGVPQLVKKDQTRSGVEVISANSREVVLRYEGETRTLGISQKIGSSFEPPTKAKVRIQINDVRQYVVNGYINGRPVRFLVDTGANIVAINSNMARQLSLNVTEGEAVMVETASDSVTSTLVNLKEVTVGGISRRNIEAVVVEGQFPVDILLGMSFLQHVDISENNGLMVLTNKL